MEGTMATDGFLKKRPQATVLPLHHSRHKPMLVLPSDRQNPGHFFTLAPAPAALAKMPFEARSLASTQLSYDRRYSIRITKFHRFCNHDFLFFSSKTLR